MALSFDPKDRDALSGRDRARTALASPPAVSQRPVAPSSPSGSSQPQAPGAPGDVVTSPAADEAVPGVLASTSQKRIALVVGIARYETLPALTNPANDARDMAAVLKNVGFEVSLVVDGTKSEIEDKLQVFARSARVSDVALVFYAGHGLQYQGVNYLAPSDAKIADETDLRRRFIKVQDVVEELQNGGGVRLMLLDACRDNEAVRQLAAVLPKSRAAGVRRGLAGEKAEGILIAFATQPDKIADDGEGRNSPFTSALLKHLPTPGQEIRTLFTRVRSDVLRATGGRQRPEVSDSLDGEFAFR